MEIKPWLEKLESLIDPRHIERTRELQRRAFAFEPVDHVPTVINFPTEPGEWPTFNFREIFDDREKMLLHELRDVYVHAKLQDDALYGPRANYGTGIIASLFGCRTVTFEDSLPIGLHVPEDGLDQILDGGVPDLHSGLVAKALDTAAWFREVLKPYPKLSQAVGSQMLDIQGPFDNASIIWGSEIYTAFYDTPEKVRRLISIVTETIRAVVIEHRRRDGGPIQEHGGDWNSLGGVCIRNDSSVNLSKDQYVDFVKPFDRRLLEEFGGWIHFCGRAHQWWPELLDLPGLKGINPYQGEFYDLYSLYEACEKARVAIVQWTAPLDVRCRDRIRTGFSRITGAKDFEDAMRVRDRLHRTGHADI